MTKPIIVEKVNGKLIGNICPICGSSIIEAELIGMSIICPECHRPF